MNEEPANPITTPKGASVVAILLGVVSVFAPFLFNQQGAVICGVISLGVIGWVYWTELRFAVRTKRWNAKLNVPVGAMVLIMVMGVLVARARAPEKPLAPIVNVDDLYKRLEPKLRPNSPAEPTRQPQQIVVKAHNRSVPRTPANEDGSLNIVDDEIQKLPNGIYDYPVDLEYTGKCALKYYNIGFRLDKRQIKMDDQEIDKLMSDISDKARKVNPIDFDKSPTISPGAQTVRNPIKLDEMEYQAVMSGSLYIYHLVSSVYIIPEKSLKPKILALEHCSYYDGNLGRTVMCRSHNFNNRVVSVVPPSLEKATQCE